MLRHQLRRATDGVFGTQRHRIDNHPVFAALHLRNFARLHFGRQIFVDEADAAFLRERNRERALGHRVHRRAHERDSERDTRGESRRGIDEIRREVAVGGNQKDIVERDAVENDLGFHRGILPPSGRAVNPPPENHQSFRKRTVWSTLRDSPRVPRRVCRALQATAHEDS